MIHNVAALGPRVVSCFHFKNLDSLILFFPPSVFVPSTQNCSQIKSSLVSDPVPSPSRSHKPSPVSGVALADRHGLLRDDGKFELQPCPVLVSSTDDDVIGGEVGIRNVHERALKIV